MNTCEMVAPATREGAIYKDGRVVRPWETEPYQLISWWDMEQFTAAPFIHMCSAMARIGVRLTDDCSVRNSCTSFSR
jgi:hypothetical protein